MGRKLSAGGIARRKRDRLRAPTRKPRLRLCALALLLTGCAACATGAAPDKNERRGFYGELSVGGAVP